MANAEMCLLAVAKSKCRRVNLSGTKRTTVSVEKRKGNDVLEFNLTKTCRRTERWAETLRFAGFFSLRLVPPFTQNQLSEYFCCSFKIDERRHSLQKSFAVDSSF